MMLEMTQKQNPESLKSFSPHHFAFPNNAENGLYTLEAGKDWDFAVTGQIQGMYYKMHALYVRALREVSSDKWSCRLSVNRRGRKRKNSLFPEMLTLWLVKRANGITMSERIDLHCLATSNLGIGKVPLPLTLSGTDQIGFRIRNESSETVKVSALVFGYLLGPET